MWTSGSSNSDKRILGLLLWAWLAISAASALPKGWWMSSGSAQKNQLEKRIPLRVLPLGASITWGTGSSTGNGYRKAVEDTLVNDKWEVSMVGSRTNGDMKDNKVEAQPGARIDQVAENVKASLSFKPNLVLINVGTNDAIQGFSPSEAGSRMESMINDLLATDGWDHTTIILSTLLPARMAPTAEKNRQSINAQYRALVSKMRNGGKAVVLAEMDDGAFDVKENINSDGIHPNDGGFEIMAAIWVQAIREAGSAGYLRTPVN